VLDRLIDGLQDASVLAVITYRPAFEPRWRSYGHVTTHMLNRLTRRQVAALVAEMTNHKALPQEVLEQIVAKTDGVPLFVEELTKTVLESELLTEQGDHYALRGPLPPLAIPATLQDSLMARLDRLESAKAVAQYASVIGRQFSYDLLQAVLQLDASMLQHELQRLIEAELLYQRGLSPQATYIFKHALIQDTAYASLLRSTRQGYHRHIAEVLEDQFPETAETQPELLAHHFMESGLNEQAVDYLQKAGERAVERSANVEAIAHLSAGLDLLKTLPDTPARAQQELALHISLAVPLVALKGQAASEVGHVYTRARELCQQVGDTSQLIPVLWGLYRWYAGRAEYESAHAMAEHIMRLAHELHEPALYVAGNRALGAHCFFQGELLSARTHLEQSIALYRSAQHHSQVFHYAVDHGVACRAVLTWTLWMLGYPDQAAVRSHEMLTLAQELAHLPTLAFALHGAMVLHQFRREVQSIQEQAEAVIRLATEQEFAYFGAAGRLLQGWAQSVPEANETSIWHLHQGLADYRATDIEIFHPYFLGLLAEVHGQARQTVEGLVLLIEALALVDKTGQRFYEAELHRLKGELLLQQSPDNSTEAESCFQQAISIAQNQSAKSWELRAATSLAHLWQSQGKRAEAHALLAPVYSWFTEGFDTADLQEAKALLDELR
jgi:predicted ATPase